MKKFEKYFVKLQTYTWPKDSHGLFDYESKQHYKGEFLVEDTSKIYRHNNELHLIQGEVDHKDLAQADLDYLFNISQTTTIDEEGKYHIQTSKEITDVAKNALDNKLYYVVRGMKKNGVQIGYKLKVSDVIKVGRVKFIVREIFNDKGELQKMNDLVVAHLGIDDTIQVSDSENKSDSEKEKIITEPKKLKVCKFCLSDESESNPDDINDILINLCKCKGSCEFTHYKCFKKWIEYKKSETHKFQIVLNNCVGYNLKKLHCELCNEPFPYTIKIEDQEIEIIEIIRPKPVPYIILERMESVKDCRALYVLNVDGTNELKIGRGHTNNILVNDISVSRLHSSIKFTDGEFHLFDNNSKFGTLVLLQEQLEIKKETVFLQCGKTVVTVSLKAMKTKSPQIYAENIEIQDTIGTPSTTHMEDIDSNKMETETSLPTTIKKRRGRPKKHVNPVQSSELKDSEEIKTNTNNDDIEPLSLDNFEIDTSLNISSKKITKKRR